MTEWIDVKKEEPKANKPVWAASPNVVKCAYDTFLLHTDKDGQWRDEFGILFSRKVAFGNMQKCQFVRGLLMKVMEGAYKGYRFLFQYETKTELELLILQFQNTIDFVFCEALSV